MLDDVAVPDALAGRGESRFEPDDLSRVGDDRVLESSFPWLRRGDGAVKLDRFDDLTLGIEDETLAVHELERDFVDVHRVGVGGRVRRGEASTPHPAFASSARACDRVTTPVSWKRLSRAATTRR